jgi:hypothetical protein
LSEVTPLTSVILNEGSLPLKFLFNFALLVSKNLLSFSLFWVDYPE